MLAYYLAYSLLTVVPLLCMSLFALYYSFAHFEHASLVFLLVLLYLQSLLLLALIIALAARDETVAAQLSAACVLLLFLPSFLVSPSSSSSALTTLLSFSSPVSFSLGFQYLTSSLPSSSPPLSSQYLASLLSFSASSFAFQLLMLAVDCSLYGLAVLWLVSRQRQKPGYDRARQRQQRVAAGNDSKSMPGFDAADSEGIELMPLPSFSSSSSHVFPSVEKQLPHLAPVGLPSASLPSCIQPAPSIPPLLTVSELYYNYRPPPSRALQLLSRVLSSLFQSPSSAPFFSSHLTPPPAESDALSGLSLSLYPGELVLLLGGRKSGASTLLSLLAASHPAVSSQGLSVCSGVVPSMLWPRLSSYQHLQVFAGFSSSASLSAAASTSCFTSTLLSSLAPLGLAPLLHSPVSSLSAGQQQTLCFLLTLLTPASVYLLDHPLSCVSASACSQLLSLLSDMRRERPACAVVVASHEEDEVEGMVDRVAVLERGRLVVWGDAQWWKAVVLGTGKRKLQLQVALQGRRGDRQRQGEELLKLLRQHSTDAELEDEEEEADDDEQQPVAAREASVTSSSTVDVQPQHKASTSLSTSRLHSFTVHFSPASSTALTALVSELSSAASSAVASYSVSRPSLSQLHRQWRRRLRRRERQRGTKTRGRRDGNAELSLSLSNSSSYSLSLSLEDEELVAWQDGDEDEAEHRDEEKLQDDAEAAAVVKTSDSEAAEADGSETQPQLLSAFSLPPPLLRSLSSSSISSLSSLLPSSFLSPASPVLKASRQVRAILYQQLQLVRPNLLSFLLLLCFPAFFAFLVLLLIGSLSFSPSSSPPQLPLFPSFAPFTVNSTLAERLQPDSPYARLFGCSLLPYQATDATLLHQSLKGLVDNVHAPAPFPLLPLLPPDAASFSLPAAALSAPYASLLQYLLTSDTASYAALYAEDVSNSSSSGSSASPALHLTLLHNSSAAHAPPMMLNALYSALLQQMCELEVSVMTTQAVQGEEAEEAEEGEGRAEPTVCGIEAINQPFPFPSSTVLNDASTLIVSLLLSVAFSLLPLHFSSLLLADRLTLRLSHCLSLGLKPVTYFSSQLLFSFLCYLLPLALVFLLFAMGDMDWLLSGNGLAAFLLFLLFGAAALTHCAALSLLFSSRVSQQVVLSLVYGLVSVVVFVAALSLSVSLPAASASLISIKSATPDLSFYTRDTDIFTNLDTVTTSLPALVLSALLPPFGLMWGAMQLGIENVRRGRAAAGDAGAVVEMMQWQHMGGVLTMLALCAAVSGSILVGRERGRAGWEDCRRWWAGRGKKQEEPREARGEDDGSGCAEEEAGSWLTAAALREKRRVALSLEEGNADPVLLYDVCKSSQSETAPLPLSALLASLCSSPYARLSSASSSASASALSSSSSLPTALLSHLTLGVHEKDRLALYGANGAGKSVALDVLTAAAASASCSGRCLIDGVDALSPSADSTEMGRKLGLVRCEQDDAASLLPSLSCSQHCLYYGRLKGMADDEIQRRAHELLRLARLEGERRVSQCGRGERLRLRVALALLSSPRLLVMRGVWGAVSEEEGEDLWRLVRRELGHRERILLCEEVKRRAVRRMRRVAVMRRGALDRILSLHSNSTASGQEEGQQAAQDDGSSLQQSGWCLLFSLQPSAPLHAAQRVLSVLSGMFPCSPCSSSASSLPAFRLLSATDRRFHLWWRDAAGAAEVAQLMLDREREWGVQSWCVRPVTAEDELAIADWELAMEDNDEW